MPFIQSLIMILSLISTAIGLYNGAASFEKVKKSEASQARIVAAAKAGNDAQVTAAASDVTNPPDPLEWAWAILPTALGLAGAIFSMLGQSSAASVLAKLSEWLSQGKTTPINVVTPVDVTPNGAVLNTVVGELEAIYSLVESGTPLSFTKEVGTKLVTVTVTLSNKPTEVAA